MRIILDRGTPIIRSIKDSCLAFSFTMGTAWMFAVVDSFHEYGISPALLIEPFRSSPEGYGVTRKIVLGRDDVKDLVKDLGEIFLPREGTKERQFIYSGTDVKTEKRRIVVLNVRFFNVVHEDGIRSRGVDFEICEYKKRKWSKDQKTSKLIGKKHCEDGLYLTEEASRSLLTNLRKMYAKIIGATEMPRQ